MPRRAPTTPRKLPRQRRSQELCSSILTATARVLKRFGYEGTNTNRIAAAAGISVGSLYQYFPNKEAIILALVTQHSEDMWSLFADRAAALEGAPVAVAARELIRLEIEAHAVDPALHRVIIEQVPRVGALGRVHDIVQRITELVRAHLEAHRHELRVKDLDLAAFTIVRAVEAVAHAAVLEQPAYLGEKLIEQTTEMVVRYLVG